MIAGNRREAERHFRAYLAHPDARYFNVGRIDRDQVQDYARRKQMPVAEIERWLGPSLAYDPARPDTASAPAAVAV